MTHTQWIGAACLGLALLLKGGPSDGVTVDGPVATSHASMVTFARLSADVFDAAAEQTETLQDAGVSDYLKQHIAAAREAAFAPVDELLQEANPEEFDATRLSRRLREIATGYRKVK